MADYILSQIFLDDNIYINKTVSKKEINNNLKKFLKNELNFFKYVSSFDFSLLFEKEYSNLKAVLEGGVNSFPNNIAVYVTSNYRHLIKENFGDRDGDDIHVEDTIQQIMSLTIY